MKRAVLQQTLLDPTVSADQGGEGMVPQALQYQTLMLDK